MPGKRARRVRREAARKRPKPGQSRQGTSPCSRPYYYLAEAAGLEVWLVNARDVRHLPGRSKTDRLDCAWLCKLNERGMLRRSFVPPEPVRDLRALTRLRARLTQDRVRHQNRTEKILEDALLKVSSVISDLMGASGRRFLQALVDGERSPAALAALGDPRLRASRAELKEALTGRFRDIHAFEIGMLLELADELTAKITRLDGQIAAQLETIPGLGGVCTGCGQPGRAVHRMRRPGPGRHRTARRDPRRRRRGRPGHRRRSAGAASAAASSSSRAASLPSSRTCLIVTVNFTVTIAPGRLMD